MLGSINSDRSIKAHRAIDARSPLDPPPAPGRAGPRGRRLAAAALAVWVLCVGVGLAKLSRYANTAGEPGAPPERWPSSATIAPARDRATLVMLAHPRCPCSRASLAELAVLMTRVGERVAAHVLFVKPGDADDSWADSDLVATASRIPGVTVGFDEGGRLAELFRSKTSGQVVVYDVGGALRFSGGITAARGHMGDNVGSERLAALLTGGPAGGGESAVFGCSLEAPERTESGASR